MVSCLVVGSIDVASRFRVVRSLTNASHEWEDADSRKLSEGLDQLDRLRQRHNSVDYHDLAYADEHRVVELFFDNVDAAVVADTPEFDAEAVGLGADESLAVCFHILAVDIDDLGDDFSLAYLFFEV